MQNEKKYSYLIPAEKFHPIIQEHLKGRLDVLFFRQLQGEFAKYYRFLKKYAKISDFQKISIKLDWREDILVSGSLSEEEQKIDTLTVDTVQKLDKKAISQAIIDQIFIKHINAAFEEVRQVCLEFTLEELKKVSSDDFMEAVEVKKDLEDKNNETCSMEEVVSDLFVSKK